MKLINFCLITLTVSGCAIRSEAVTSLAELTAAESVLLSSEIEQLQRRNDQYNTERVERINVLKTASDEAAAAVLAEDAFLEMTQDTRALALKKQFAKLVKDLRDIEEVRESEDAVVASRTEEQRQALASVKSSIKETAKNMAILSKQDTVTDRLQFYYEFQSSVRDEIKAAKEAATSAEAETAEEAGMLDSEAADAIDAVEESMNSTAAES